MAKKAGKIYLADNNGKWAVSSAKPRGNVDHYEIKKVIEPRPVILKKGVVAVRTTPKGVKQDDPCYVEGDENIDMFSNINVNSTRKIYVLGKFYEALTCHVYSTRSYKGDRLLHVQGGKRKIVSIKDVEGGKVTSGDLYEISYKLTTKPGRGKTLYDTAVNENVFVPELGTMSPLHDIVNEKIKPQKEFYAVGEKLRIVWTL